MLQIFNKLFLRGNKKITANEPSWAFRKLPKVFGTEEAVYKDCFISFAMTKYVNNCFYSVTLNVVLNKSLFALILSSPPYTQIAF